MRVVHEPVLVGGLHLEKLAALREWLRNKTDRHINMKIRVILLALSAFLD